MGAFYLATRLADLKRVASWCGWPARPQGLFVACPGGGVHRQGQGADTLRVSGRKLSVATPVTAPRGGQVVLHARAPHGNPLTATP